MTMIAPYGQATMSSAYHDVFLMLQPADIHLLNVMNDRPTKTTVLPDATMINKDDGSTSTTTKTDNNAQPRRKGILSRGKEQREPCSPVSSSVEQGTNKRKEIRKIRFCESVQCLLVVPKRREYTRDDISRIWYVDQEYKAIKNEILLTLKQMMKTFPAAENEHICYRGLESRTKEGALHKMLRRENAYDAVLGEQARQFDLEFNDPNLISIMYKRAAEESCRDAVLRAQKDAKECSMLLVGDKRRSENMRKLFFGLPRDGINRAFDSSSRAATAITSRST